MTPRLALLDRDGTINVGAAPGEYIETPDELVLLRGAGEAVARLNRAGVAVAVVTNQRGVALGRMTLADLEAVHAKLERELSLHGAWIDAVYACPHAHDECTCRKPQPGMLVRAAAEQGIDLPRSWFVGDILDDVEAGERAGCRTILVDLGTEPLPPYALREPDFVARDTAHALAIIAAVERLGPAVEMAYLPRQWEGWVSPPRLDALTEV